MVYIDWDKRVIVAAADQVHPSKWAKRCPPQWSSFQHTNRQRRLFRSQCLRSWYQRTNLNYDLNIELDKSCVQQRQQKISVQRPLKLYSLHFNRKTVFKAVLQIL
jgi:hypothetical protein